MPEPLLPDDAPAMSLFPQFESEIYDMFATEVRDLTDRATGFRIGQVGVEQMEHPR